MRETVSAQTEHRTNDLRTLAARLRAQAEETNDPHYASLMTRTADELEAQAERMSDTDT